MKAVERLEAIQKEGVDNFEALALSSEEEISNWIEQGKLPEDAYSWWNNAQEEMRCMMSEFV